MAEMTTVDEYQHLIRLVRLGRQLEMSGNYNAAKLFWAAAFAQEIRESNKGLRDSRDQMLQDMDAMVEAIRERGAGDDLLTALKVAADAVKNERPIPYEKISGVHVCRACGQLVVGDQPERCPSCGGFELTFRSFPPVHYLDPMPPDVTFDALATIPTIIETFLDGLTDEEMEMTPAEGEWSIREVIGHLVGAQELISARVNKILDEDNPSLKSLTVSQLAAPAPVLTASDLFRQYKASREAMMERLRDIGPADWWRTGMHEEFGKVTLLQQAGYFAKHDHAHLTQFEQIRRAIRKE